MQNGNNIKIAHLVCVSPPYNGGIGTAALKQAQIGLKYGYNVSLYAPNYSKIADFETINEKLNIYRIKPLFAIGNSAFINMKKHIKNIDILHIHYPFYFSIMPAILEAKKHKKKIITFWHMNPNASGIKGLFFKLYQKFVLPWIIKKSDKVLVSTKDYFSSTGFKALFKKYENKIEELPFSVDTNMFKPLPKDPDLIKQYLIKNKHSILFVGGLDNAHYFKGVKILLNAFASLSKKNYRLFIVGDGDLKNEYIEECKNLNIENNVIFLGAINNEELIKYYNLTDVLILPSINQNEAFGIVQIEAMACAKPVIVSNLPGVRTVLENKRTGFVFKTGDTEDLVEKINKLFEDEKKYKKMCENARNRVVEKFIDAVVFQKLNKIYENLLGQ